MINNPLISADTQSAVNVLRKLGAVISYEKKSFCVEGFGKTPAETNEMIDVRNSGTTLRIAVSVAALKKTATIFTGDEQIQKRPVKALLDALNKLGAKAVSLKSNGTAPLEITGPISGGEVEIECMTSQFLTSLLITLPLLKGDSKIIPTVLNEKPYVDITLWWFDRIGVEYERKGYDVFYITGDQSYDAFECTIPGDFSSATFFIILAAISGGRVVLENLDLSDPQGDKKVLDIVRSMGAEVTTDEDKIIVKGHKLEGIDIDLNSTPDSLPAFAVLGCYATGKTRLLNVPQARLKETDRIHVMYTELKKMGAKISELEDGLEIEESNLHSARLEGHHDHRVVMALALAGAMCEGTTTINTAQAMNITFPNFVELMNDAGMKMEIVSDE